MATKKFLLSVSYGSSKARRKEFVIPYLKKDRDEFYGLDSGKCSKYAMIVFTGVEMTKDLVFSKLVDKGHKVSDAKETLALIDTYIKNIEQYKIGNILRIQYSGTQEFELIKVADTDIKDRKKKSKLP
jgi:hypothetical protein